MPLLGFRAVPPDLLKKETVVHAHTHTHTGHANAPGTSCSSTGTIWVAMTEVGTWFRTRKEGNPHKYPKLSRFIFQHSRRK